MSAELKACPFCGKPPKLSGEFAGCDCIDERISDEQFDLVKSEWNFRPIEDDLRSKLAIAVEALEECRRFCNEFDYEPTYNDIENIEKALAKIRS